MRSIPPMAFGLLLIGLSGCSKKEPVFTYEETRQVGVLPGEVFLEEIGTKQGPFTWHGGFVVGKGQGGFFRARVGQQTIIWERPAELNDVEVVGQSFNAPNGDGLVVIFRRSEKASSGK